MTQGFSSIRLQTEQGCEPREKENTGSEVHCHLASCLGALFILGIGGVELRDSAMLKPSHLANIAQKMKN